IEIRTAGVDLVGLRIAVAGWPALDDIGNEHRARRIGFAPRAADRLEHLVEQLAGAADERLAARIFVGTRPFADDHQRRMLVADAEYGVGARPAQFAGRAILDHRPQAGPVTRDFDLPLHLDTRRWRLCRGRGNRLSFGGYNTGG